MIAYDPETDFTVRPWLEKQLPGGLGLGEVIGGDYISATEGDDGILVYGDLVKLKGTRTNRHRARSEPFLHQGYSGRHRPRLLDQSGAAPHHPSGSGVRSDDQDEARQ